MPAELTRARVAYLEALAANPDADMTQAEADEWFAAVDASKPATNREADWNRWYATPVADVLFARTVRIHVPARSESRPGPRRRRSSSRSPDRLADDPPPEPDLTALRAISPEAFASLLERVGL